MGRPDQTSGAHAPDEQAAILRRAAELSTEPDPGRPVEAALSTAELAEVAAEAGIDPAALATAVAEAKAGLARRRSRAARLLDRVVGPGTVEAGAPVAADEEEALAALERWLSSHYGLDVHVDRAGVVVGGRRRGLPGAVGAGVRRLSGQQGLDRARSVRAAAAAVDDEGAVYLVVDISNRRSRSVAGGSAVAGGSLLVVATVAALTSPVAFIALPAGALAGLGAARRSHRRTVDQVGEEAERTVVAVGRDQRPEGTAERLLRAGRAGLPRRSRDRRS
ncbi:MAG: hypothetical protein AAGA93_07825 [Actinomycetota bacterium]